MASIYQNLRHIVKKTLVRMGFHSQPSFLIIGAQKGGTTFLYSVLRQHEQIVEPVNKEAHFFDYEKNYQHGLFKYKMDFDLSIRFQPNQVTFEATPDYIAHYDFAPRISQSFPDIKMILLLREPIARAYSAWKMHHFSFKEHDRHQWLHDSRTFEEVVQDALSDHADPWDLMNHIGRGRYGMQLTRLFEYVDRKNVLVLFQDDLKTDTQGTLDKVTDFVGIDKINFDEIDTSEEKFWSNKGKVGLPDVKPEHLDQLKNYYEGDRQQLETLLDKPLKW